MSKVILSCLLLLVAGCATKQVSRSGYVFENITLTCAYNTLEEMDGITKIWIYYDRLHGWDDEGIGFKGEGFYGSVLIQSSEPPPKKIPVDVVVYSEDHYWGFGERLLIIQQIKQQIKESLFDRCNE